MGDKQRVPAAGDIAKSDIPEAERAPNGQAKSLFAALHDDEKYVFPFWNSCFLKWMKENPDRQTYHLWMAAASNLAYFGEEGREAFHELSRNYNGYLEKEADRLFESMLRARESGIGPVTYEKLREYGFEDRDETDAASPATYVLRLATKNNLAKMGITIDEEKGKVSFNPNIFAEYLQTHNQLLVHEGELFYQYNGSVWRTLPEHRLKRLIRDTIQGAQKNLYRSWMGDQAMEMLRVALAEAGEMNPYRHLVNLANGMFDVNTGKLLPHDPAYRSTVQIPLEYSPDAECSRFEQFVGEIMEDDPERVAVLQEVIGYLLSPDTKLHYAYFFYGQGSNGKSVLLDIVVKLVGAENTANLSLTDLESSFKRANLVGKTINIATENEMNPRGFNSQHFKAITSGDPITVEQKFRDCFSYKTICKMVYAVNTLPYTLDKTHGFYRRVYIVPFNRRFDGKAEDKDLKNKLEAEMAGIFNWAMEGLRRLRDQKYSFSHSSAIEEVTSQYKEEQNPIMSYMREMLEVSSSNTRVTKASVIEKYNVWTQRNGLGDGTKMSTVRFWSTFRANCKELGMPYEQQQSNGVRYLRGIALQPEAEAMKSVLQIADTGNNQPSVRGQYS